MTASRRAPGPPITVLVVDDHAVVREGLRALLGTEPDIEVAGEAGDGETAVRLARALAPDVVLMDLVMPGVDGIEAIRRIRADSPDASIVVLTSFGNDDHVLPAVQAGAIGYLLKDASPAELVRAVRRAADGESCLDPSVARRVLRAVAAPASPGAASGAPPTVALTARERDVLRLLARGLSNEAIAGELFVSEATVRTHVSHVLDKLGVHNRTQAALRAVRDGLVPPDRA